MRLRALAPGLVLLAAACGSTRFSGMPGGAVVVFEPGREDDAARARDILTGRGWIVDLAPAGPAHRTRSSLAVYGQAKRAGLGDDLPEALAEVGTFDVLPFLQEGPGLNDAVLWLAAE